MIDEHIDEPDDDETTGQVSALPTPIVSQGQESTLQSLRERRTELEPLGKTQILEVPGYESKLAVEYNYIGSEETELISKRVIKETKKHGGRGLSLLSSTDLLIAACKQVLIRSSADAQWEPMDPAPVRFDNTLAEALGVAAGSSREIILAVFGSEHAVIEQNMRLSNWLTDVTREVDDDFFGL